MRTDVHAPKNLKPEDYEFVGCGNYSTADLDAYTPYIGHLIDEGWSFDSEGAGCRHCGQFIIYFAILKHIPSHKLIKVGETCLDNRFSLANAEFQKLRKAAKLNRERKRLSDKRKEFLALKENAEAFEWAKEQQGEFEYKFCGYIDRYGEASDKFVAAILRSKARAEEWAAKRAEEAEHAMSVIEGRYQIRGEILSAKWKFTTFGDTLKIVVKDEGEYKVHGTCPAAILNEANAQGANDDPSALKGLNVTFTATVKASDDDKTFGFFSRPVNGVIL